MAHPDYRGWAAAGVSALQRWYDPSNGQWKSTSWWNAANALTAVIGYTKLTGDGAHAGWNEAKTCKNAITNELFLTLAALLHQRTPGGDGRYLTWALRTWEWFSASGLIGANGLVNDGLTAAGENNGGTTWTYNQGVILGGLGALFEITGDRAYLDQGESIANATLSKLTTPPSAVIPGILAEPCEAATGGCDGDQVQFKGIFVRYLHLFWLHSRQSAYRAFILSNARSLWDNNRNASDEFGLSWTGPFDRADAARQSSALDGLNAAVALAPGQ